MNQLNVLVCDDDKAIVDALEIYLKQEGHVVIKTYTGMQALEALQKQEIHLIILDVMMPELDGISTIIKIREDKNIPIG